MLKRWIHKICSRFPGYHAGEPVGASPSAGLGRGASASRPAAVMRPATPLIRHYLWTALILVFLAPVQGIAANNGDKIVNRATFHSSTAPDVSTAVTVTARVCTTATIEFMKYVPGLNGATFYNVSKAFYKNNSDAFVEVPAPFPFGSPTPLDLNTPLPLSAATIYHAGEPLFIKVVSLDQNLDKTIAETVMITVTDTTTGDTEILRLTETGTDTGTFIGYLQTATGSASSGNGVLAVAEASVINGTYSNSCNNSMNYADAALVDPDGIVFDTVTGKPVDGVTVELLDAATGLGATVYGDNGAITNIFPNKIISGTTATDAEGKLYSFPQGTYRFPYVTPGNYILKVTPPDSYSAPSTVATVKIQTLPGTPYTILETGSRGGEFAVPTGPAIRVDLPIDPRTGTLWLSKSAGKSVVSAGEFMSYDVTLENSDAVGTLFSVIVTDRLPPGFSYQKGSTRFNGKTAPDPVLSADGRTMTFAVGTVAPKYTLTIRYVVAIGAGTKPGKATNIVTAATTPAVTVNTATAAVLVQEPFMMSRSLIMGRVIVGACSDKIEDNKKGMEGIGIYLEDGTFVFSDKFGMFHFEGVRSGSHVVQLDLDSIPEGYKILPCEQNSRFAGRAYSQFVDMQGGTMWRTDFYLGKTELSSPALTSGAEKSCPLGRNAEGSPQRQAPEAQAEPTAAAANKGKDSAGALQQQAPGVNAAATKKGEISFELVSSQNDETIDYRIPLQAHTVALKNMRLQVSLPGGARYIYGSSSFNGTALLDPEVTSTGLVYLLEETTATWRGELQFRTVIDKKRQAGELLTRAVLRFDTAVATNNTTPEVTNILSLTKDQQLVQLPQFVFRPHFPTFGSELSAADLEELDSLANRLADKIIKRIDVTGHTDNVRIAPRSRDIHVDNTALSLARAKSVGRFLTSALHLPPDALYLNGSAGKEPAASNNTAAGRALNRRVEVKITALQRVETSTLKLIKERSGVEKQETIGAPFKQKYEVPLPPKPLQLNQETVAPLATTDKSAAAMVPEKSASPAQLQTKEPVRKTEPVPAKLAVSDSNEPRVELASVINEGTVHYRVKLKGIKQPAGKITVALTLPKSLLYMTGTSRLLGTAVADPEVSESTLRYTFAKPDEKKKFDLRLQALFDGDENNQDSASRITVEIADESGKLIKTLAAQCILSDNMLEINSPDPEDEAVNKPEGASQPQGGDDATLYQEKREKLPLATTPGALKKEALLQVKEDEGINSPPDGSVVAIRINAVRIALASALTPVLLLDGKEVPADRIGFTMKDRESGRAVYSYIGVDFGEVGDHTLQLKGVDPFGVVRFDKSAKITRAGEIANIRFVAADNNIADGKSPVRVKVQLFDTYEKPVNAAVELTLKGNELRPLSTESAFGTAATTATVSVSGDGWINFQPVTSSGIYRTNLSYNKATLDIETYVKPKMRDWILVGIAEGTAGYNALSGHMENAKSSGADDLLYDNERLALYAKGTIKGEWLLTMAYDSAKQRTGVAGNALFQTIDPNTYYTLYGDAAAQGYDAASQSKLYLKIERDQFYAMFGDYDTGLTVTELSRYSRRMNGIKSEFRSKNVEVTAFGSETGQSFVKDEIRGDGTSGLYRLSRKGIVLNSDKITIESHDRFHSEIITNSRQLSRFIDYNIDYDTGAIFFKSPVPSKDEQLNPVFIVVDYEITNAGGEALTYGGRAGTTLLNGKLKAGATYVHEGQVSGESNLYGVDAGMQLGPGTKARAEFATTTTDLGTTKTKGNAYLAEITHTDKNFDGRAYYREQDSGFGLGQQQGSETGTRKYGVDGAYKLNQQLSVGGQAYRQYNLATGAVRDFIESVATYTDKQYSGRAGLRYANDSLADGSNNTSIQATVGGSWKTLNERLTLRADHEQSLFNNNNTDFPTRSIFGMDYQVTKETLLFAQEELTYGAPTNTNTTRVGMKITPWSGGTVASSVVNDMRENNERTFANVGLTQKWQVTPQWAVDGGLDHNQTIRKKTGYSLYDPKYVPPASGGESFTAVSLGANYTEKKLVWSNRIEYRNSDTDDKWGIISGLVNEQGLNWGWTARLQMYHTQSPGGSSKTDTDLRFGLAYRPPVTKWIILDRLDLIAADDKTATSSTQGKRIINNLNANYKPDKQTQVSIQYGAKYVLEKIDEKDYSGYTDLVGIEGRYDITKVWDLGLRSSMLHTWDSNQFGYSFGPSVGYNVMENAWISLGYNVVGFHDKDFSAANYTAQGPYVQFRFKFDQNSVKDAAEWLNKQ